MMMLGGSFFFINMACDSNFFVNCLSTFLLCMHPSDGQLPGEVLVAMA